MKTLIRNGQVCLNDKVIQADILIEDEKILDIQPEINQAFDEMIDASGCYVLPGLIDFHVHLDDQIGDYYIADTYKTGSQAAIQNGITTMVSFVTQKPKESLSQSIVKANQKAQKACYCDYTWHLTPTTWDEISWRDIESCFERGFKTLKLYATYKPAGIFSNYFDIKEILHRIESYGIRTLIHCEDERTLENELRTSYDLDCADSWAKLRSKAAEKQAIHHIAEISASVNAPVHIVHVSTVEGAEIIREYKQYAPLTAETAPQYLFLDDHLLKEKDGYRYLCTPPLRDLHNQRILRQMATQGLFDIFATDHCPFNQADKSEHADDITQVPKGMPGIGALLPMIQKLYEDESPEKQCLQLVKHLSENPAKLSGHYPQKGIIQKGADADLVLLDFNGLERTLYSTVSDVYDPYAEFKSSLEVKQVLLRGNVVVKEGQVIDLDKMMGKCLVDLKSSE